MRSVFFCHSSVDKPFVRRLAGRLHDAGIRVWLDEAELHIGDSLIGRIGSALQTVDFVAVVLSSHSIQSIWVQQELRESLTREFKHGRPIVLPILLERVPLPPFLADKLYVDFSSSSDDVLSLARLIAAIQQSPPPGAATTAPVTVNLAEDIAVILRSIGSKHICVSPYVPPRLVRKASALCGFSEHRKMIGVLDCGGLFPWERATAAVVVSELGVHFGGPLYLATHEVKSVFVPLSELAATKITVHFHSSDTGRQTVTWNSFEVCGVHFEFPENRIAADVLVRVIDALKVLVRRVRPL